MDSFIKTFVSCYFLIWKTFLEVINNGLGLFLSFSLYRYTVGRPHKLWTHYVIVSYNFVAIFIFALFLLFCFSHIQPVFFLVLFCFAYLGM